MNHGPETQVGHFAGRALVNPYNSYMRGTWSIEHIGDKLVGVFEPLASEAASLGILFLHDVNGQAPGDYAEFTEICGALGIVSLAPHGNQSWWTDKICSEFDRGLTAEKFLLESIVPAFGRRWRIESPRIGLLGFGMGGQGVLRLAFKYPERFQAVAALAASLDYHELYGQGTCLDQMYDSKEHCRQDTALLQVHPAHYPAHIFFAADPGDSLWYRGNDRLHEKLSALGIAHDFDGSTSAAALGGPYYSKMVAPAVQFLVAGLKQHMLRLL
jgi:poly(3-hydroxybutyrate) depolymerase